MRREVENEIMETLEAASMRETGENVDKTRRIAREGSLTDGSFKLEENSVWETEDKPIGKRL